MELTRNLTFETTTGETTVELRMFGALHGWDMQRRYITFAGSDAKNDADFRKEYTMEVLQFATVLKGELRIPLSTPDLIENHLQSWQNLELVFKAVLEHNGIDPEAHAARANVWADNGAEMATSFMAALSTVMTPAIESMLNRIVKE